MGGCGKCGKSRDFPTLSTANCYNDEEERPRQQKKSCSEGRTAIAVQTDTVEKGGEKEYNQAAAGKEGYSKQGSRGTCSGLTK